MVHPEHQKNADINQSIVSGVNRSISVSEQTLSRDATRYIYKRSGEKVPYDYNNLFSFMKKQCKDLNVDYTNLCIRVDKRIPNGSNTDDILSECSRLLINYPSHNMGYRTVGDRISLYQLKKNVPEKFSQVTQMLDENGILDNGYALFVRQNAHALDRMVIPERDSNLNFLSLETGKKTYLLKIGGKVVESPQYLFMRVAVALHYPMHHLDTCRCPKCEIHLDQDATHKWYFLENDSKIKPLGCCMERINSFNRHDGIFWPKTVPSIPTDVDLTTIFETYDLLSKQEIMHASPTMFNAGTKCGNLSSCFLGMIQEDSIEGIYSTLRDAAKISQSGGAFGISATNVRSRGERIVTTNGVSNGVAAMLTNYNTLNAHVQNFDNYKVLPQGDFDEDREYYLEKRRVAGDKEVKNRDEEILKIKRKLESIKREISINQIGNVPSLARMFNETANYVDQGGNKRKGATAIYLEPWHRDFTEVMSMKLPEGAYETKAFDLFNAGWMTDVFMERLDRYNSTGKDVLWSFMSPKKCPDLIELYGKAHKDAYLEYERKGIFELQMPISQIWTEYSRTQLKVGAPYTLFKDTINSRNNQEHIGTVKGSNLCTEIMEVVTPDEIAVCNLASINLEKCTILKDTKRVVDYQKIAYLTSVLVKNVNQVIDRTLYPVKQARYSNLRHRPMGLGVMGKTGMDQILSEPYDSVASQENNHRIFETMMWSGYNTSCDLAAKMGRYETYDEITHRGNGSRVSRGLLVFDGLKRPKVLEEGNVYKKDPNLYFDSYNENGEVKTFLDWTSLREKIAIHGLYNSLIMAPMPTATTSKFVGVNESFEAPVSLIYSVTTMAGTNTLVNNHLVEDLIKIGLWNPTMYQRIISNGGSIKGIEEIPLHLRNVYRTVWEINLKPYLLMAHARGLFIDQSQSFNVYLSADKIDHHTMVVILAWKLGIKGLYYITTKPETQNMQVSQVSRDQYQTQEKTTSSSNKSVSERNQEKNEYCTPEMKSSGNCLSCD